MDRKNATLDIELSASALEATTLGTESLRTVIPGIAAATEGRSPSQRDGEQPQRMNGIVVGRLVGRGGSTGALVDYPGSPSGASLPAISTVLVENGDSGREVALAFQSGDPRKPVVVGFVQHPGTSPSTTDQPEAQSVEVERDGDRLTLTAEREIVLRCGKASITLTRAGKVLIRGKYLLSRSSGVNRIKGGSVQIN